VGPRPVMKGGGVLNNRSGKKKEKWGKPSKKKKKNTSKPDEKKRSDTGRDLHL